MQVSNFLLNPDGEFQLTISGAPGPGYIIYESTNLVQWDMLATLTNTNGTVQFTDTGSTNFPARYYRISAPQ